ncbi:MAG: hydrogenase maturation protease [Anaerolineae bacterium]|nr:hydrogenase maturation protease [Anaerolineae bacterium]
MPAKGQPVRQNLRILISGVGNVLRQDDGFGIAVVHRLLERGNLPDGVTVLETGIAGIRLVQELLVRYDVLILVDAMLREGYQPGDIYLLEADVPDIADYTLEERSAFLADMHYTNPTRAMMFAKAMDVLPKHTYILGCQPAAYDDFDLGLSPEVEAAVPKAVARIDAWIEELNQKWTTVKKT